MELADVAQIPLQKILSATNEFADEKLILSSIINVRRKHRRIKVYKAELNAVGGSNIADEDVVDSPKSVKVAIRRYHGLVDDHHLMIEVRMLSRLEHKNIVSVFGFCYELYKHPNTKEQIIIYRHDSPRSLVGYLSDPILTWMHRLHICIGIASALKYMHKEKNVIHCNISSSVVLLDENWEARLIGFEFADDVKADLPSNFRFHEGTVDPISKNTFTLTYKSDVYSFGILLLEIMCGKKIDEFNENEKSYINKSPISPNDLNDFIHPNLKTLKMRKESIEVFTQAAYDCLRETREDRSSMDQIVIKLKNARIAQQRDELRIPLGDIIEATNNFHSSYMIDKGGFGEVYKAELKGFKGYVAIKNIFRIDYKAKEGFDLEIDIFLRYKHPNIVPLLGLCEEEPKMIYVTEYAHNGSLNHVLRDHVKKHDFNWVRRIKVCLDIASGLNHLHTVIENKPAVIHLDIKSGNILIGNDWKAKIADFGLSVIRDEGKTVATLKHYTFAGTSLYGEPEFKKEKTFSEKSDIYSFGVVLFEIYSGIVAFDVVSPVKDDKGNPVKGEPYLIKGSALEKLDPIIEKETYETIFTSNKGPNKKSLNTFVDIANLCLEERAKRPTMKDIIRKLRQALFQANLKISFKDIKETQEFGVQEGEMGKVYRGELSHDDDDHIREKVLIKHAFKFTSTIYIELEILFNNEHKNVIGLVGYCDEEDKRIIVYEDVFRGTLDQYLDDFNLGWTQRLKICIDIATGLEFLHKGDVRHGDIRSTSIVITNNWEAKIANFGNSFIYKNNKPFIATDIQSFGYVMFEIVSGSRKSDKDQLPHQPSVFEGIKNEIVPESLETFLDIAKECFGDGEKPTAHKVIIQLKKALEYQPHLMERDKEIMSSAISDEGTSHLNVSVKKFETGKNVQEQELSPLSSSSTVQNPIISTVVLDFKATTFTRRSKQKVIDSLKHEVYLGVQQEIVLKEEIRKVRAENNARLARIQELENQED